MNVQKLHTAILLAAMSLMAIAADSPAPGTSEAPKQAEVPGSIGPDGKTKLPYVHIDLEKKTIDLDGEICLVEGVLELIATVAAGKEHEAIVRVKARPRNVHLALLMLGLKPGSPGKWDYDNGKPRPTDPTGDGVAISVVYQAEGKTIEKPVHQMFKDHKTGKHPGNNIFLFAGSSIARPEGEDPFYSADATGDVVTLVSFQEELLAWPKAASNSNDQLEWVADTAAIPKLGTPVKLRLKPAGK